MPPPIKLYITKSSKFQKKYDLLDENKKVYIKFWSEGVFRLYTT